MAILIPLLASVARLWLIRCRTAPAVIPKAAAVVIGGLVSLTLQLFVLPLLPVFERARHPASLPNPPATTEVLTPRNTSSPECPHYSPPKKPFDARWVGLITPNNDNNEPARDCASGFFPDPQFVIGFSAPQ
jgi:hypothetical protein